MKKWMTLFSMIIATSSFSNGYTKCKDATDIRMFTRSIKNCTTSICILKFECDLGKGPVVLTAACKMPKGKNVCPSPQDCIADEQVQIHELDENNDGPTKIHNSSGQGASRIMRVY